MSFSLNLTLNRMQEGYLTERKKNPSLPEWSATKGILKEYAKLFFHKKANADQTILNLINPINSELKDYKSRIFEGSRLCQSKILRAQDNHTTISSKDIREIKDFFTKLEVPVGCLEEEKDKLEYQIKIIKEITPFIIKISEVFVSTLNQFDVRFEEILSKNYETKAFKKALKEFKDRLFPVIPHTRAELTRLKNENQKPDFKTLALNDSFKKTSEYFTALLLNPEANIDEYIFVKETLDQLTHKMKITKKMQQNLASIDMVKNRIDTIKNEHAKKISDLEAKNQLIGKMIKKDGSNSMKEFIDLEADNEDTKSAQNYKSFSNCVKGITAEEVNFETLQNNKKTMDCLNTTHQVKLEKLNKILESKICSHRALIAKNNLNEVLMANEPVVTDHDLSVFQTLASNPNGVINVYKVYTNFLKTKIERTPEKTYWLVNGWL